jgi:hypothetical protein
LCLIPSWPFVLFALLFFMSFLFSLSFCSFPAVVLVPLFLVFSSICPSVLRVLLTVSFYSLCLPVLNVRLFACHSLFLSFVCI